MVENIDFNTEYSQYANQTLNWLIADTEDLYQKNLTCNYEKLKENDWIDKSFTYQFNSFGFRCEEFSKEPTIMFLGCSFTCGIGLPLESIWPELVSKYFGVKCANLGIGGGSADTAFRMCLGYIEKINPIAVVYLQPPEGRVEVEMRNFMSSILPNMTYNRLIRTFYKVWASNKKNNIYLNLKKNSLAMHYLCLTRNIPFIEFSLNDLLYLDLARDLSHAGTQSHLNFSKIVIAELENKKISKS